MQKATVPKAPMADDQLIIFCKRGETACICLFFSAIQTSRTFILSLL